MKDRVLLGVSLLLGIITVLAVLKLTKAIAFPFTAAAMLVIVFRPLQKRLDKTLPFWLSSVLIIFIALVGFTVFFSALSYSVTLVITEAPDLPERIGALVADINARLARQGVATPTLTGEQVTQLMMGTARGLGSFAASLGLPLLTLVFFAFFLFEARYFHAKIENAFSQKESTRLLRAGYGMAVKFERYAIVQVSFSLLIGVATVLICLLLGVRFPFIWGLIAFLLNFIPNVGSVVAVLPPALYAALFGSVTLGVITLLSLSLMQMALGSFLYPRLHGSALRLSTTAVFLAVIFWGWMWGIGGAFIAVPLTSALVLICSEYPMLRPLAVLLSEGSGQSFDE